eukprot:m.334727 g.334727  ORF g.334727 m.334727 type:complete len:83 (+) comp17420_c0_seq1:137-385(+)
MATLKGDDPVAMRRQRVQDVKETLITLETVKVLRERLGSCYAKERTNHLERCKGHAEAYLKAIEAMKHAKGGIGAPDLAFAK